MWFSIDNNEPSGHFRRRFDVEKMLKNVRIFQRQIDVKILTFDVDSTSNQRRYFKAFIGRRKTVEKRNNISTSNVQKIDYARWVNLYISYSMHVTMYQ